MKLMNGLWCVGLGLILVMSLINQVQADEVADKKVKVSDAIKKALAHENRPAGDKARDKTRKPGQVLAIAGIQEGQVVADLMTGGGYYAELISRVVGKKGKVYAQNNKIALGRFADKAMKRRLEGRDLHNVIRYDKELEDLNLPEGKVDAVFMVLFYHDTYWMKVDRKKMNEQIMKALKPGGVFIMIDHHAAKGTKARDVKSLHRVDAEMVKGELLKAGFKLVGEYDLLRNKKDDHTINVFSSKIRGRTDRFFMKFVKPKKK